MKRILVILLVMLMAAGMAAAEEEPTWFELTGDVLTVRLPVEENAPWEFAVSDESLLELLTMEIIGNEPGEDVEPQFAASFRNFGMQTGEVTLTLTNGADEYALTLAVGENSALEIVSAFINGAEDMRASYNPEGYVLFRMTDVFVPDGGEELVVQGTFGGISRSEKCIEIAGFDPETTVALTLSEECEILLPEDLENPASNVAIEDLRAWHDGAKAACEADEYAFYASFEMNPDGELTRIEYCYMP